MDSSIQCPICLDVLVEAIVLRCGHSFCELCLDEAVNVDDRSLMGLRKEARAVTYSILHKSGKPLTLQEIEDEWMSTRRLPEFPDDLRAELHRTILSSPSIFQMIEQNNDAANVVLCYVEILLLSAKKADGYINEQRIETGVVKTTSEDNKTNYTQFFVLLVSSILTLAALICVARILFVYCAYKRREQDEQNRRTQTRNVTVASQHNHGYSFAPESGGVSN
nr:Zinc finger domain containing protein [Haemonchus contortus]